MKIMGKTMQNVILSSSKETNSQDTVHVTVKSTLQAQESQMTDNAIVSTICTQQYRNLSRMYNRVYMLRPQLDI